MKQLFGILVLAVLSSHSYRLQAQGMAVNTTGVTADGSAILDVSSTAQGMLVPRMTAAQRTAINNPATGLLVYQTDGAAGFFFNSGTTGSPVWTALNGAPTGTAGGDLSGTYPNPTVGAGKITMSKISATGSASSSTLLRGDGAWSDLTGFGLVGGSISTMAGNGNFSYPISSLSNRMLIFDCHGANGGALTLSLLSPSLYPAGTIIRLNVVENIGMTAPSLTLTNSGSTFLGNAGTSGNSYTISSLHNNYIVSDGVSTWYVFD